MNEYARLLKNLVALAVVVGISLLAVYFLSGDEDEGRQIDDTPIQVETIRTIAEISTVSYMDEVVIDTVEFYHTSEESDSYLNELTRMYDELFYDNIKRRLTLIIRGEIRYGIDLTDHPNLIKSNRDTLWLTLPNSEILDVMVSPSMTEVFHEQGEWDDGTRKQLEEMAKNQLRENAEKLDLKNKANENAIQLFRKLLRTKKKLVINFE